MKVLIDLDRALGEGVITSAERDKLLTMARGQTSDLALNILIALGIVAATVGLVAWSGSAAAVVAPGCALGAVGLGLVLRGGERWRLLGEIMLVVGTSLVGATLIILDDGSSRAILAAAFLFAAAAIVAENGLLAAAAVVAICSGFGASTTYTHARYTVIVEEPTATILICAVLGIGLVAATRALPKRYERIALIAARTAAMLANFAFLVGTLWGDRIRGARLSPEAFSVAWAVVLLAVAIWAHRENRRWPLVAATVFAALHFYTQFFERVGAHPVAIALAGLATIGFGYGLKRLVGTMPKPA